MPEEQAVIILNNGFRLTPGKMETMLYGEYSYVVYVTWDDEDGNFYEPVMFGSA